MKTLLMVLLLVGLVGCLGSAEDQQAFEEAEQALDQATPPANCRFLTAPESSSCDLSPMCFEQLCDTPPDTLRDDCYAACAFTYDVYFPGFDDSETYDEWVKRYRGPYAQDLAVEPTQAPQMEVSLPFAPPDRGPAHIRVPRPEDF